MKGEKKKKPNTRNILLALDTETQLLHDDTPLIKFQEEVNKRSRQLVEQFKKGVINKKELLNKTKCLNKELSEQALNFEKEGIKLCNTILTYALGYCELPTLTQIKRDRRFSNQKRALMIHEKEKHQDDFFSCKACNEMSVNDTKVFTDIDNKNNVWKQFFDEIESIKAYEKAQKGKTHKLKVYVHNLKFDACSLLEYITPQVETGNCEIGALVIKDNAYYSINFVLNGYVYEFCDSLKVIVQPLAKCAGLVNMRKTTEDATYNWFNLQDESILLPELDYLKHDVMILNRLIYFIKKNLSVNKLTAPSFAYSNLRGQVYADDTQYNRKYWNVIFKPSFNLDEEAFYRRAYYGGVTLVMPEKDNKLFNCIGYSFDVNSEYPSAMTEDYPNPETRNFGNNLIMKMIYDRHDFNAKNSFYRIQVKSMKLKKGAVPCFPKKTSRFSAGGSVISKADLKHDVITLIGYDLEHIETNYNIDFDFLDGCYFTQKLTKPFYSFVKKMSKLKERATRDHNKALKLVAKLNLNSCYGKLAERFNNEDTLVSWNEDKETFELSTEFNDRDWKPKGNIVLGTIVTAKARNILLTEAEKLNASSLFDVTYFDTDSIHGNYNGRFYKQLERIAQDLREGKEVDHDKLNEIHIKVCNELALKYDEAKLGYFKAEGFFDTSVYLGPKRYLEKDLIEGDNYKIAGVQKQGKEYIATKPIDWLRYTKDHELIVPFTKTVRVHGGYKFIDTYKILSSDALYTS